MGSGRRAFRSPCIPTIGTAVPTGAGMASRDQARRLSALVRKDGDAVSIITRGGYDFTDRYPLIVAGALRLRGSFVIDGEGVVCGENGVADFDLLHSHKHDRSCFLYAFDMVERSGDDLRSLPLEERKARLRSLLWLDLLARLKLNGH